MNLWTGFDWYIVGTSNVRSDRKISRLISSSDIPNETELFGKLDLFPSLLKEVERNLLSWIIVNINDWTSGPASPTLYTRTVKGSIISTLCPSWECQKKSKVQKPSNPKCNIYIYIVTCISVAREQLGKHLPAKKNCWPTIGKVLSIDRQRAVNKFL
jgi:hypothetical protein